MSWLDDYFSISMTIGLIILLAILIPVLIKATTHQGFTNNNLYSSMGGYHNVQYNQGHHY
jgi:uncharacterized membrane protein